jgi:hypothetical protein
LEDEVQKFKEEKIQFLKLKQMEEQKLREAQSYINEERKKLETMKL